MAIKMSHCSATDRYCSLAPEEVQISQGLPYDLSSKEFVGNVSAELIGASKAEKKHTVPVTHVLCCMTKGIITKFDMPFT